MKATRVLLLIALFINTAAPVVAQTVIKPSLAECKAVLGSVGTGEYPVDIVFSGISVFDRSKDGVINVRLPNLVGGRKAISDKPVRAAIKSHIAYILADVQTAKPLIDAHLPVQPAFNEGSCYVYYRLTDETVTVEETSAPMATNKPICITEAKDSNFCPDTTTEGSMHWLPSFATILGSTQKGDKKHFQDPDGKTMAGLVTIDRGYLQTVVTSGRVWAFLKNEGDTETMRQAIAQEVHWRMHGKGSSFILHLKGSRNVDLTFAPQGGGKGVVLFVANSPIDETGPILKATPMDSDQHFRAYYEFIDSFDVKTGPLPFKSSKKCQSGSVAVSPPTLQPCVRCPDDPSCEKITKVTKKRIRIAKKKLRTKTKTDSMASGDPLPSGLNCGSSQWP